MADVVGAGSAGVALGADELAEVPAAEKTAQFESDKKALESSSVAVLFDGVGIATSGLPGIDEVPSTLAEGGVKTPSVPLLDPLSKTTSLLILSPLHSARSTNSDRR